METIELVYVLFDNTPVRANIAFIEGMTVADILEQSGWIKRYPDLLQMSFGVFSRKVNLNTKVIVGDRVEIYRPLRLNPMEIRRQRAKKKLGS